MIRGRGRGLTAVRSQEVPWSATRANTGTRNEVKEKARNRAAKLRSGLRSRNMPTVTQGQAESQALTLQIPIPAVSVIAPPPEWISKHNFEPVMGLPTATFPAVLALPGAPRAIKIGRTRAVPREELAAFLLSLRGHVAGEPSQAAPGEEGSPETLLRDMGYTLPGKTPGSRPGKGGR